MIYKSSSAYSFGKVKKDTQSSFVNNLNINNPDFNKYQGDVIIKPTKGYAFSKGEKFKKIPIISNNCFNKFKFDFNLG